MRRKRRKRIEISEERKKKREKEIFSSYHFIEKLLLNRFWKGTSVAGVAAENFILMYFQLLPHSGTF